MTDTNQASELLELCKEVYERTGWNRTEFLWVAPPLNDTDYKIMHKSELHELNDYIKHPEMIDKMYNSTFCYDTDYLLEKLPEWTRVQKIGNDTGKYSASYELNYTTSLGDTALVGSSDTPLKALLKLTIALSEAGELK